MGCTGGSIFYFFKGFSCAPSRERFKGALTAIKHRGPVLGGGFAMWGGLFSLFDCFTLWYRQKESPINGVLSGFLTGGILAARAGYKICWRNALAGGLILSIIEGVGMAYNSYAVKAQMLMMHEMSKINEERVKRMSMGLPDYTQEELHEKLMASQENQQSSGFFGFSKG